MTKKERSSIYIALEFYIYSYNSLKYKLFDLKNSLKRRIPQIFMKLVLKSCHRDQIISVP